MRFDLLFCSRGHPLPDNAIRKDGFKIVLLVRSSPLHPYGVCNYLFGVTSVTLWDYTVASLVGMLPGTMVEVYFGTAIKNVADIVKVGFILPVFGRFLW